MPGISAKTAEVKLRVPVDMASAIETYAQAHTHGNKTKAYLHFLEVGISAESDNAPVTKADLLAVAAATQATVKQALAAQNIPALPSAEELGTAIGITVDRSVARHMASTSESIASQIARRLPSVESRRETDSRATRDYQRGFVAGKEAEDRRALAVALNMNAFMRNVVGVPFIRTFLPEGDIELLASQLPQANLDAPGAEDYPRGRHVASAQPAPAQPASQPAAQVVVEPVPDPEPALQPEPAPAPALDPQPASAPQPTPAPQPESPEAVSPRVIQAETPEAASSRVILSEEPEGLEVEGPRAAAQPQESPSLPALQREDLEVDESTATVHPQEEPEDALEQPEESLEIEAPEPEPAPIPEPVVPAQPAVVAYGRVDKYGTGPFQGPKPFDARDFEPLTNDEPAEQPLYQQVETASDPLTAAQSAFAAEYTPEPAAEPIGQAVEAAEAADATGSSDDPDATGVLPRLG